MFTHIDRQLMTFFLLAYDSDDVNVFVGDVDDNACVDVITRCCDVSTTNLVTVTCDNCTTYTLDVIVSCGCVMC